VIGPGNPEYGVTLILAEYGDAVLAALRALPAGPDQVEHGCGGRGCRSKLLDEPGLGTLQLCADEQGAVIARSGVDGDGRRRAGRARSLGLTRSSARR
jgi:hypothetical protein